MSPTRVLSVAASVFAGSIAAGAALIYVPAGLIVAGIEGLVAVWTAAYLLARRGGER